MRIFEKFKKIDPAAAMSRAEKAIRKGISRLENLSAKQKGHLMRGFVAAGALVIVAALSVITAKAMAPKAAITVDGKSLPLVTIREDSTEAILADAGVTVGDTDLVDCTDTDNGEQITVRTATNVTVSADGAVKSVLMHWGDSVGAALVDAGITLGEKDKTSVDPAASVRNGMSVSVTRCYAVSITVDGETKQANVWQGSVQSALSQTSVTVGADDIVTPAADTALSDGLSITVQRVAYRDVTTTEDIPYESTTVNDSTKDSGTRTVTTAGEDGERTVVSREELVDGVSVSSTIVSTEVTTEPVTEVIAVGTRSPYATVTDDGTLIDQEGNVLSYSKVYTGRCTTYCYGTRGASGLALGRGTCAVNPNLIPYGTKLYICSPDGKLVYGYAVAADTGTAAMDGNIVADLFYDTLDECCWFGARTMSVYILN